MEFSIAFLLASALGELIYDTESVEWRSWQSLGPEFVWYIRILVGTGVLIGFYVLENVWRPKKH